MIDILGMLDNVLSAVSLGRAGVETSDDESNKSSKTTDEDVEHTKATTHKIIERRKHEIKERRDTQVKITDQHRHQHKR